jgi:hypothetical protein
MRDRPGLQCLMRRGKQDPRHNQTNEPKTNRAAHTNKQSNKRDRRPPAHRRVSCCECTFACHEAGGTNQNTVARIRQDHEPDGAGEAIQYRPSACAKGTDNAVKGADDAVKGTDDAVEGADDAVKGTDDAVEGADDAVKGTDDAVKGTDDAA